MQWSRQTSPATEWIEDPSGSKILQYKRASMQWDHTHFAWTAF